MRRKFLAALAMVALLLTATADTEATLISQDLRSSGDGLLTFDTDTGLSWLDVTEALGRSRNEVLRGYGGLTTELGFRYATENELSQLLSNAGVTEGSIWGYWNFGNPAYLATSSLISLLGTTYQADGNWGIYAETSGSHRAGFYDVAAIFVNDHADSYVRTYSFDKLDWDTHDIVGSLLVRDDTNGGAAPVPEPSTICLLAAGLAGLVLARRKMAASI